ncbi:MAG: murein biosynthesis integral membrane protein MurJ [Clostridia bacterium]|nr:murein biosynthesis integral membrane protein MurJ [Clostridia bacterium]
MTATASPPSGASPADAVAPTTAIGAAPPAPNRARATLWVTIGSALSKPLGYLRDAALAAVFGASATTDAFFIAQTIPQVLFATVAAGLGTTFVPVYTQRRREAGPEAAKRSTDAIFTAVVAVTAMLAAALWVFAPSVVSVVAPGFGGPARELAVHLTRIMLPSMLFLALATVSTAALQAHEQFTLPAMIGIPYNVVLVASILGLGTRAGIDIVGWGVVAAVAAQWLLLVPAMRRIGFRYRFSWNWRDPALARTLALTTPVVVATGASQLGFVVDRMLASLLPSGRIAALSYANRLYGLPTGVFVAAIVTVAFPLLAQRAAARDFDGLRAALRRGLRLMIAFLTPVTVALIVLRRPLVQLLFQHGAFTAGDARQTAFALGYFALGLVPLGAAQLLQRAFFSLQDTRTPMILGVAGVAVNVAADLALVGPLAQGGLALGTSLNVAFQAAGLLWVLRRRLQHIGGRELVLTSVRAVAAGAAMALVLSGAWVAAAALWPGDGVLHQALRLAAAGAAGGAAYLAAGWLLGMREFLALAEALPARWRARFGRP